MENSKREIIKLALLLDKVSTRGVFIYHLGHVQKLDIDVSISRENYNEYVFKGGFYTFDRGERNEKDYLKVKNFLLSEIERFFEL